MQSYWSHCCPATCKPASCTSSIVKSVPLVAAAVQELVPSATQQLFVPAVTLDLPCTTNVSISFTGSLSVPDESIPVVLGATLQYWNLAAPGVVTTQDPPVALTVLGGAFGAFALSLVTQLAPGAYGFNVRIINSGGLDFPDACTISGTLNLLGTR